MHSLKLAEPQCAKSVLSLVHGVKRIDYALRPKATTLYTPDSTPLLLHVDVAHLGQESLLHSVNGASSQSLAVLQSLGRVFCDDGSARHCRSDADLLLKSIRTARL